MNMIARGTFIDEAEINETLGYCPAPDAHRVRDIFAKARDLRGLTPEEVAVLMNVSDPLLISELRDTARYVKEQIYGSRLVLFAPLYISNYCSNDCPYCAFRSSSDAVRRRALTQEEIAAEVRVLVEQGHKRVLLVAGESYTGQGGFDYILHSIATIYATRVGNGEIRRVNVNIAPLWLEEFQQLKDAGIGTYQLFQETYHRPTYADLHRSGPKVDYNWRVTAMHRAMEAGINDVGIGVLFGLYDWKFEVLAMFEHIRSLEREYGVGPHTISVPRLEPAVGAPYASNPPYAVSDEDFLKLIAILRLAVPYTGMILSTREDPWVRTEAFELGISQISAGSRTDPGGYVNGEGVPESSQFQLGDHRSLDEVIRDISGRGFMPSFCTACYRLGRTGRDFMDLAKPGEIKNHCEPNAISTFEEYLIDYASPATRAAGEQLINIRLAEMSGEQRSLSEMLLHDVRSGKRDAYL
jgi:2-iminoacetate synthase